jgi:hypothetical protein
MMMPFVAAQHAVNARKEKRLWAELIVAGV